MTTFHIQFVECTTYEMEVEAPDELSSLLTAETQWTKEGSCNCRFIDCTVEAWRVVK